MAADPIFVRGDAPLVLDLIEHFTYVGLFLVLFVAGLGVPVPEEIPVLAAGALAHEGIVRWWIALPVCLAGVLAGDAVLYWVGHHWGERILEWRVVRFILSKEREATLLEAYRRHGVKIVLTARHIMGLRAAAFLTAGLARVPFWKFIAVDAGAAAVGVPLGFGLAFFFADQIDQIRADVGRVERWLVVIALLALAAWLALLAHRRTRRLN
ncbi:MAG TPA: DedA family protein [Methylomirabilota bacterium]|nr:DedA family protein [Methylomirabilota bacterium]